MASNKGQPLISSLSASKHTLSSCIRLAKSVRQLSNVRTQHELMSHSALKDILGTKYRELKTLRMTLSTKAQEESTFPGIQILYSHLLVLEDTLNGFVNDLSEGDGRDLERPRFDELMYCSGVLEGHATILLEHSTVKNTNSQMSNAQYQVSSILYPSAQYSSSPLHIPGPLFSLQPSLSAPSPHNNSRTSPTRGNVSHNDDPSIHCESCYISVTSKTTDEDEKMGM